MTRLKIWLTLVSMIITKATRFSTLNDYRAQVAASNDWGASGRDVQIPVTGDILGVDDDETESSSAETAIDYKGKFTVDVPEDF